MRFKLSSKIAPDTQDEWKSEPELKIGD